MALEVKLTCPLGHTCERVVDGAIERCMWYKELAGRDPQSEEVVQRWDCAIAWLPLLNVEMSGTNRGQTAAIESMRNETVKRQDALLGLAIGSKSKRLKVEQDETWKERF